MNHGSCPPRWRSSLRAGWFGLLALTAGCEFDVAERLSQHPEVEGVALITEESTDPTRLTLRPWGERQVRVEFLDARGRPIPSLGQDHRSLLEWIPTGSAVATPVPGESFLHTVTVVDPCSGPTGALVGYGHDARADERVFGPFPVLVEPQLGGVRAFGPDSVELTPAVRLPSRVPIRIDVRYHDCDGEVVEGLQEAEYEILVFFITPEFADWTVVEGPGNQVEILVHRPPGARGQISFGIRKFGELPFQPFGPFPLTIY